MRVEGETLFLEREDLEGLVSYLAKGVYFQKKGVIVKTVVIPMYSKLEAQLADHKINVATQFPAVDETPDISTQPGVTVEMAPERAATPESPAPSVVKPQKPKSKKAKRKTGKTGHGVKRA